MIEKKNVKQKQKQKCGFDRNPETVFGTDPFTSLSSGDWVSGALLETDWRGDVGAWWDVGNVVVLVRAPIQ